MLRRSNTLVEVVTAKNLRVVGDDGLEPPTLSV